MGSLQRVPLPTVKSFHLACPFVRLSWIVPLLLWYTEKRFGSVSHKCLQSNLWLSRLNSCPAAASRIAHSPLEIMLNHQALAFYERALHFLTDNFPLQQLASRSVQLRLKKRPSCSLQKKPSPQRKTDLKLIRFPLDSSNYTVTTFIEG